MRGHASASSPRTSQTASPRRTTPRDSILPWRTWPPTRNGSRPASGLGGAALLEPVNENLAPGVGGACGFEPSLGVCVVGAGVDVGALSQEILGHPALAAVAGLPESRVDLAAGRRRVGRQELIHLGPVPQPGRLPQTADARAPGSQQPGHMPAPVA